MPGNGQTPENWSSVDKFAVVLETSRLNEAELSEYCRKKGLMLEQVARWRKACEQANASAESQEKEATANRREDQTRVKDLERELKRKDKALAETAALLVLSKKISGVLEQGGRGRLIPLQERERYVEWIRAARQTGARKKEACAVLGIS